MHRNFVPVLLVLTFGLIASPSFANHPVNISDQAQVKLGKKIYQENCATCHGVNLQGPENPEDFGKRKPPRLDAKGHGSHHSDQVHFKQIELGSLDKSGKLIDGRMPSFHDVLKDNEIWAAISYIKSHWPKNMRMKQIQMSPGHRHGQDRKDSSHHMKSKGHMR